MKCCFVDYRISFKEQSNLESIGLDVLKVSKFNKLYMAIDGHPDIQIHILDKNTLMVHPDIDKNFLNNLEKRNIKYIFSKKRLLEKYPDNIALNAVNLKDYFIHNLNNTDSNLLSLINHKKLISVKQGYTKCSCAIVNNKAIITSDKVIAKTLINEGFDILLLPPGDILLQGLDYGFIGGCCGLISPNKMAFFGDLRNYLYGELVLEFLDKYNIKPIYLSNGKLIDRGSILVL
ncbi:hypothetical protein CPJCM30710_13490 [Clostridium polyendosporum]|uniref:DUF6873 domain-containing protein n=1 Tax=Clostridium polyendosporum TaxID=69208 RepID=A0A919VLK2_9CLOT|nr:hypothetical protein [Clostridium polyendosporum]GIM28683.1 hypothetical protein CPJCM30710_13490 [Clostridium polyendosporum]